MDKYVLIEAYETVRRALIYPEQPTELTYVEFLFLLDGYSNHYSQQADSVYSPQFEKGMRELNNRGGI